MQQWTFADYEKLTLNPSVKAEDERRLHRSAKKLLGLFRVRKITDTLVSTIDIIEIGKGQYNSRLWEVRRFLLKHCNQCIDRIRGEKSCYYYKIVPKEQSTFYAERKAKLDIELEL